MLVVKIRLRKIRLSYKCVTSFQTEGIFICFYKITFGLSVHLSFFYFFKTNCIKGGVRTIHHLIEI